MATRGTLFVDDVGNRGRLKKPKKDKAKKPRPLRAADAPPWTRAACAYGLGRYLSDDFVFLTELINIQKLADGHPLKQAWQTTGDAMKLSEVRFEFHHLADDLRLTRDVPGARRLLQHMLEDAKGYEALRYELRVAGCAARGRQRVERLGERKQGPDVEFMSRSGHRIGVACYRAESLTPALDAQPEATRALVEQLTRGIATHRLIGHDPVIDVMFPKFPPTKEHEAEAVELLAKLWREPFKTGGGLGPLGVDIRQVARLNDQQPPNQQRAHFRLHYPLPSTEKSRIARKLVQKAAAEHAAWVSAFDGVPIICVEESTFALGLDANTLADVLDPNASHGFAAVAGTRTDFFTNLWPASSRHRMEHMEYVARRAVAGLNIEWGTFGANMQSFADGWIVVTFNPSHATEEWLMTATYGDSTDVNCERVAQLQCNRRHARLPPPAAGIKDVKQDPVFMRRLEEEIARMPPWQRPNWWRPL